MANTNFNSAQLAKMCTAIDCINTAMALAVAKFLRKVAVIKRLAQLLEISGDLITLPDISKFIPIVDIDMDMYLRLRNACPELGLPAVGSVDELVGMGKVRESVASAYVGIDRMLNDHPWNRAGWLQDRVDAYYADLVAPVVNASDAVSGMLACFSAICDTASQLGTVSDDTMQSLNDSYNKLVASPGELTTAVSDSLQVKVDRIHEIRVGLRAYAPQLDPVDFSDKGLGLEPEAQ